MLGVIQRDIAGSRPTHTRHHDQFVARQRDRNVPQVMFAGTTNDDVGSRHEVRDTGHGVRDTSQGGIEAWRKNCGARGGTSIDRADVTLIDARVT